MVTPPCVQTQVAVHLVLIVTVGLAYSRFVWATGSGEIYAQRHLPLLC